MNPQQNNYVPPPVSRPPAPPPQQYASQAILSSQQHPLSFPTIQQPLIDSSAYSRATSTDPGSMGIMTGEVGTPMGSEGANEDGETSGPATPLPTEDDSAPAQPVKRSKALNFLKKKETKVNVKGTAYKIIDDEIQLEDDPRGEAKIDDNGTLLGGRSWKVHTFTSPMRTNTEKLYMLSIDAARCAGFRDSLYFFRRNPLIHKLSCSQPEKDRLIELGKLSGNLKSRAVTMVSARNVFKVMGATFVADGKYILDDYYEGKSLAAGHKPGEPAFIEPYDPEKDTGTLAVSKGNAPPGATSLGLNVLIGHPGKPKMPGSEFISSTVGGGMHATFGGNGLQPFGKSFDPGAKKAKPASHLTVEDWMYEYAKEVAETNKRYIAVRRSHVGQVAISLGVEEKEEDCWEMVEEEYTDDEPEPVAPPQPQASTSHGVPPPPVPANSGYQHYLPPAPPPPARQPSHQHQPPHQNFSLPSTSSHPYTHQAPFDPSQPQLYTAQPTQHNNTFSLPSTSTPSTSSYPSAPTPAPQPQPQPKVIRPKKKRMTKRFNPIRGFYELETNVPHVYQSTQPSFAGIYRSDPTAHLYPDEAEGDEAEEKRKKRKRESEATKVGAASLEFVSWEKAWNLEENEGREPLIPGIWDFGAGPEGLRDLVESIDGEKRQYI